MNISAIILAVAVLTLNCAASDWQAKQAAAYLDARQGVWFAWKPAVAKGGPCVSCHTGVTYLLARPALRKALGESGRTNYETGLLNGLAERLEQQQPKDTTEHSLQAFGVESVLSALLLSTDDASSERTHRAFERMWAQQLSSGSSRGAWNWFHLDLDPWETTQSTFYGASLAALAVGNMDKEYRQRSEVREHIEALKAYLQNELPSQPLHNRLVLLSASSQFPDLMPKATLKLLVSDAWKAQQPDGGWTLSALGPWKDRADIASPSGSHAYATALAAYSLQQAGISRSDSRMKKALAWLTAHQHADGYWDAVSMNKIRKPDSVPYQFMRDAATAYAALALAGPSK